MPLSGTARRHRVYFMRHGAVDYFDADGRPLNPKLVTLNAEGRAQAVAAASLLAEIPFDRVICSGTPRSRETAALAIGGRRIEIEERPALREIRGGRLADIPRYRLEEDWVYSLESAGQPDARFAGGDDFATFERRVMDDFLALLAEPGWTQILLAAHDVVNRVLLGWACGGGLAALAAFEQEPGCINIVDIDLTAGAAHRKLIRAVNITPANPAKRAEHLTSMERVLQHYAIDQDKTQGDMT